MGKKDAIPDPPGHLGASGAAMFRELVAPAYLEAQHLAYLVWACEQQDRATAARVIVAEQGIVIMDRFGCPKEHPACAIERAATLAAAKHLKQIGLDLPFSPNARK